MYRTRVHTSHNIYMSYTVILKLNIEEGADHGTPQRSPDSRIPRAKRNSDWGVRSRLFIYKPLLYTSGSRSIIHCHSSQSKKNSVVDMDKTRGKGMRGKQCANCHEYGHESRNCSQRSSEAGTKRKQMDKPKSKTESKKKRKKRKRKRKRKRKKKADPNRPKRPLTPFMLFSIQTRMAIKKEHPRWDFGKLSATVGKMWHKVEAVDRVQFEKLSNKDKVRYEREMQSYVPPPESSSSEEEEEEESDEPSADSNEDEDDQEDEDASSDEEEKDLISVRRRGKRSKTTVEEDAMGPGPPYSRVEYCAVVNEEPHISLALAKYVPTLSSTLPSLRFGARPAKGKHQKPNAHKLWKAVEDSAGVLSATVVNGVGIIPASMSPLPGFAKHVLLTQCRRSLACFITLQRQTGCEANLQSFWNTGNLQEGHTALSHHEVHCMKMVLEGPTNVGTCDLMSIPNYDELMSIPTQLMECRRAERDRYAMSASASSAMEAGKAPFSVKCIYVRSNASGRDPATAKSNAANYDYCLLSRNTPWLRFSSEVLAIIWEVKFLDC